MNNEHDTQHDTTSGLHEETVAILATKGEKYQPARLPINESKMGRRYSPRRLRTMSIQIERNIFRQYGAYNVRVCRRGEVRTRNGIKYLDDAIAIRDAFEAELPSDLVEGRKRGSRKGGAAMKKRAAARAALVVLAAAPLSSCSATHDRAADLVVLGFALVFAALSLWGLAAIGSACAVSDLKRNPEAPFPPPLRRAILAEIALGLVALLGGGAALVMAFGFGG